MTCRSLALGRMRSDGSKCQVFSHFLRSVVNCGSSLPPQPLTSTDAELQFLMIELQPLHLIV